MLAETRKLAAIMFTDIAGYTASWARRRAEIYEKLGDREKAAFHAASSFFTSSGDNRGRKSTLSVPVPERPRPLKSLSG